MVFKDWGECLEEILVFVGLVIQEFVGQKIIFWMYQDFLENFYDEDLFEYYIIFELVMYDLEKGILKFFVKVGMIVGVSFLFNDQYIMVEIIYWLFFYLVFYYCFLIIMEVYDLDGNLVKLIDEQFLIEQLFKGFGVVLEGKCCISWWDDQLVMFYWVEVQDGGDLQWEVDVWDKLFYWLVFFKDGEVKVGLDFEFCFSGIVWGNVFIVIVYEYWWAICNIKMSLFILGKLDSKKVLFDCFYQDCYSDFGSFEMIYNEFGE